MSSIFFHSYTQVNWGIASCTARKQLSAMAGYELQISNNKGLVLDLREHLIVCKYFELWTTEHLKNHLSTYQSPLSHTQSLHVLQVISERLHVWNKTLSESSIKDFLSCSFFKHLKCLLLDADLTPIAVLVFFLFKSLWVIVPGKDLKNS